MYNFLYFILYVIHERYNLKLVSESSKRVNKKLRKRHLAAEI